MYAYCNNNPITFVDPDGSLPKWAIGALAIAGGVLMAATIVAALPAAACFAGAMAATYLGASAVATATVATYVVGALTAVTAGAYTADSFYNSQTGDTVLLDMMGGNETLYQAGAIVSSIATAGIFYMASQGYAQGTCFIAGTLVATENGNIPIEDISVGDMVFAYNADAGETALKEVVNTFVRESNELVHISVNGEKITTTPTHPFWVPQKGWTQAIELRAGDRLQLLNGEYVIIEQVQHEILEKPITVYNFEVADFHTYYVGGTGVLVHNSCRSKNKLQPDSQATGAHTVIKQNANGEITNYATYMPNPQNPTGFDEVIRFDRYGAHGEIVGPHVHLPHNIVREPYPWEIPKS